MNMKYEFVHKQLSARVTQITEASGVSAFLVTGTKAAALLDTCSGLKGLKETVEKLTPLPLTVILTHGHGDHAGSAADFETVYLHPADRELLKRHNLAMRMDYVKTMLGTDELSEEDFVPDAAGPFEELKDGQIFDLGGIHLEIIHVPGHTKGSCCILLKEEAAILYGDACNGNTLVMDEASTDISTYRKSLEHLKTFDERYDTVYYSHGPAIGPRNSLDDNIELCGRILAGTDDAVPCEFMGRKAIRAAAVKEHFERIDGKYGNIVYSELTKK